MIHHLQHKPLKVKKAGRREHLCEKQLLQVLGCWALQLVGSVEAF